MWVFKYCLDATLIYALPFLRVVRLRGKLENLDASRECIFLKIQDKLAFGLLRWCLCLLVVLCIDEVV